MISTRCTISEDLTQPPTSPLLLEYTYSPIELELLVLIDSYRFDSDLPYLDLHPNISVLAKGHNSDMIFSDSLSHSRFPSRLIYLRDSLGANIVGENVGYGYGTASGFFNAWLNSEGHRAVLSRASYSRHGLSISKDSGGRYYATHIFID
jgi:uncharacterized protein YkwD